jgi:lipopolysaccharide transport system ATP-binding protein
VGDAEFQKKCLGKMKDVSVNDGRTVLFVSHNMGAVSTLCDSALLMRYGKVHSIGPTADIIRSYLEHGSNNEANFSWNQPVGDEYVVIESINICNAASKITNDFFTVDDIYVNIFINVFKENEFLRLGIRLLSSDGSVIFTTGTHDDSNAIINHTLGRQKLTVRIPGNFLNKGIYFITVAADIPFFKVCFFEDSILSFKVEQIMGVGGMVEDDRKGYIRKFFKWNKNHG